MKTSLYGKNVHLKNIDVSKDLLKLNIRKTPGMEASYHQVSKKNKEVFASITATSKEDINNKLCELSKNFLLADRCRTLKNIPKYRIINTTKVRIQ